jgi:hypothetical protein
MKECNVNQDWLLDAACATHVDPDLWFRDDREGKAEARAICAECPVLKQCRDKALKDWVGYGYVIAGMDARQLRTARNKAGIPEPDPLPFASPPAPRGRHARPYREQPLKSA